MLSEAKGNLRLSSEAWRLIGVLASISIVAMYVEMVMLPSLPTIERQFGVTESEASWVLSSETLAGLAIAPILGKLADMYGRKRVLLYILSMYFIAVLLTSLSPTYTVLVVMRGIQGIGLSINPIAYTILRDRLPRREWPMAQGIIASTFAIGAAIALPIGSYIAQYYSWQTAYETALPILLALITAASIILPESGGGIVGERVDYPGLALLSLSFAIMGYSFTEAPIWGWYSLNFTIGMLIGISMFAAFIVRSRKVPNPIIDIQDFSNPNIAVPLLSSFVSGFGLFLAFQALVYLFELPKPVGFGMTILQTGLTLAPISLVMLVAGPMYGVLMTKVGYRRLLVSTSIVASLGGLLMAVSVYVHSLDLLIMLIVFSMIGIAGMMVTRVTLLVSSVSRDRMATLTGTNTSMRLMGNTLGPVIASSIETTYRVPILAYIINGIPIFYEVPGKEAFAFSFIISAATALVVGFMATKIRE